MEYNRAMAAAGPADYGDPYGYYSGQQGPVRGYNGMGGQQGPAIRGYDGVGGLVDGLGYYP